MRMSKTRLIMKMSISSKGISSFVGFFMDRISSLIIDTKLKISSDKNPEPLVLNCGSKAFNIRLRKILMKSRSSKA